MKIAEDTRFDLFTCAGSENLYLSEQAAFESWLHARDRAWRSVGNGGDYPDETAPTIYRYRVLVVARHEVTPRHAALPPVIET